MTLFRRRRDEDRSPVAKEPEPPQPEAPPQTLRDRIRMLV